MHCNSEKEIDRRGTQRQHLEKVNTRLLLLFQARSCWCSCLWYVAGANIDNQHKLATDFFSREIQDIGPR